MRLYNKTIQGIEFQEYPKTNGEYLVTDMTSNFMSKKIDFSNFGLIYAGAQKNFGPSGLSLIILRKDLYSEYVKESNSPFVYNYANMRNNDSCYINPPIFSMYFTKTYLEWVDSLGGVEVMNQIAQERSSLLYNFIDNSEGFYTCPTVKEYRSRMNVPFIIKNDDKELTKTFLKEAEANGLIELKGHRSVGGCRASIYNGMPVEGVKKLVSFMKSFYLKYK